MPTSGASAVRQDRARRLFLTRLAIAAISTAACTVGLLPALLYLDQGAALGLALSVVAMMTLVAAFRIQPTHLHQPSPFEFIAAGLSAVSQGALVSVMALSAYIFVRGAHWLLKGLVGLVGYSLPFGWVRPATIAAFIFGGLGLLGIVTITVKGLWQALYPPVAGYPTPFRNFARSPFGKTVLTAALLATVGFAVFAFEWPISRLGFWSCLLIAYTVTVATISAWATAQKQTAPRKFTAAEETIGAMLRALGFMIIEQPRTGFPEIDPYLADLDFALSRDDRTFAMLIQEAGPSDEPDLQGVSRAAIAAHALLAAARKGGGELASVEPVLITIGGVHADELLPFAAEQNVLVIVIEDPAELQQAKEDHTALRTTAERLFQRLTERRSPVIAPAQSIAGQMSLPSESLGRAER